MDDLMTSCVFHLLVPPVHLSRLIAMREQTCWRINVVLLSSVSP